MTTQSYKNHENQTSFAPADAPNLSRRGLFNKSLALASGVLALPALIVAPGGNALAHGSDKEALLSPRYFPLKHSRREIDLRGKLAVVTGASRGNGRAAAESLLELGVNVIGTSRNPAGVPNPPAYPLLPLDIADPASVFGFVAALQAHPLFQSHRQVDILINNAGRFVVGQLIPQPPTDLSFYLSQRDLALRTVYSGHVMLTNAMLALLPRQGYGRVMFTVSIVSYYTGATVPGASLFDAYSSAKTALRGYANNLDATLRAAGSSVRVSTVNPYTMNTTAAEHPNPIYTQPVNGAGRSDTDPFFNAFMDFIRPALANALPTRMIGDTYAQLLQMTDPEQNVVVASPHGPLAAKGLNNIIEPAIIADNLISAVPLVCR